MKFGICTSVSNSTAARDAGWDYIEEAATALLQGLLCDEEWSGPARAKESALPILACNLMVPASLKITGQSVNFDALLQYLQRLLSRAAKLGVGTIAFGSGAARSVPNDSDFWDARRQLVDFLRMAGAIAAENNVMIAVEPLRPQECNLVNTMSEALELVREVDRPRVQCLFDSYHVSSAGESIESLRRAASSVRHIHVADLDGRAAPGESGSSDYRPAFAILKQAGYDALISVEATGFDIAAAGKRVLEFLKKQWNEA